MKRVVAFIALITISIRLAMLAGATYSADGWLGGLASDERIAKLSLMLEFGALDNLFGGREDSNQTGQRADEAKDIPQITEAPLETGKPQESAAPEEDEPEIVPTTISGGLVINNATSYSPDIYGLIQAEMDLTLSDSGPQILIIHTHGSEAYTPDAIDQYVPSDESRTEDLNYNVVRVGDELQKTLENFGLQVVHDRSIYDYPSYSGSYARSLEAIEDYLETYPTISVVIDLHRDALGSGGVIYKTAAEVQGQNASQVMLLVGTGENGLPHPEWEENLKFALHLQMEVNQRYPTLARPVALKQERYNQHLTAGSIILEVGSSGNTLSEALCAVRLFGDAIGTYLLGLVDSGS